MLNNFQLKLFHKYADVLKRRFSEDFQEVRSPSKPKMREAGSNFATKIVSTDDYMPMTINTLDEYEKVLKVTWFTPDKPVEELT